MTRRALAPCLAVGALLCAGAWPAHAQSAGAPVARAAALSTPLNTALDADLAAFASGTALTGVAITAEPRHGVVTVNGTRVRYVPAADYFGADGFSYVVFGAGGVSAPAVVSMVITGRPDPTRNAGAAAMARMQADGVRRLAAGPGQAVAERMNTLQLRLGEAPAGTDYWLGAGHAFGHEDRPDFRNDALHAGADRRFSTSLIGGVALTHARDRSDLAGTGAMRTQAVAATLYGLYAPLPGLALDAALGYGAYTLSGYRLAAQGAEAALERTAGHLYAAFGAAYERQLGKLTYAPYARVAATRIRLAQADETGAAESDLRYGRTTFTDSEALFGLRVKSRHETEFGWVLPRARIEWRHAFGGGTASGLGYADGFASYALTLPGAGRTRSIGLGGDIVLLDGLTLSADYQYDRGTDAARSQSLMLRVAASLDGRGAPPALTEASALTPTSLKLPLELSLARDSNVARAGDGRELADTVQSATLRHGWRTALFDPVMLQTAVTLAADKLRRFSGLDRVSGAAQADLLYKTGAGPTLGVYASASRDVYSSAQRDGERYGAGLSVQHSSGDWQAYAALARNLRHAGSAVFSGAERSARAELTWTRGRQGSLYGGVEVRDGDAASSGPQSLAALDIAKVLARDDTFVRENYFAYRYDARTVLATLGYTLPLGPRNAVDLAWRQARTRSDLTPAFSATANAPLRYASRQLTLSYLTSF
jgi:uncharacterized protein YhjY with autotransporter beta-barrel domain